MHSLATAPGPGGDRDSTHSADVDYAEHLPSLFQLQVGNFYIALCDDTATSPETAFAKIKAKVAGTRLASAQRAKLVVDAGR
jgi:hypothetical protein